MGFRRRLKHKCGSEANWQGGVFSQGSLKMLKRILEMRYDGYMELEGQAGEVLT